VQTDAHTTIAQLQTMLKKRGFTVESGDGALTAEYGKYGRLAATVTHIGLLTLLAGVTVTSWTGFSGFQPVRPGEAMSFIRSDHSKLWVGKLPSWEVRVDGTSRENHPTGDPKQWYSDLAVVDGNGKVAAKKQISVNDPLSYGGVDVYQSSWGLDEVRVAFNGSEKRLPLQPMGKRYAAFLPLDATSILIFSVLDQKSPMRIFAKRADWQAPRIIKEVKQGESANLGMVRVTFVGVVPVTGLQYKCDPGIPIVYTAFGFIMLGVLLAIIPHRHVWASVEPNPPEQVEGCPVADADSQVPLTLFVGGKSYKAKIGFERMMDKALATGFGLVPPKGADDAPQEEEKQE
jgi:cytochrome c biogenesis protein